MFSQNENYVNVAPVFPTLPISHMTVCVHCVDDVVEELRDSHFARIEDLALDAKEVLPYLDEYFKSPLMCHIEEAAEVVELLYRNEVLFTVEHLINNYLVMIDEFIMCNENEKALYQILTNMYSQLMEIYWAVELDISDEELAEFYDIIELVSPFPMEVK